MHTGTIHAAVATAVLLVAPVASREVLAQPETGRIEGVIRPWPRLAGRSVRYRPYAEAGQVAAPATATTPEDELLNVVVYLDSLPPGRGEAAPNAIQVIAQRNETFSPRVVAVTRGTRVDFTNEDSFYHNVFSLSGAASFDLGRYRKGASRSVVFSKVGLVQVFCDIHSDMSAVVLVRDNAHFVVPTREGRFVLEGVPAGEHTVVAWHERIRPVRQRVRVGAGESVSVRFDLPQPLEDSRRGTPPSGASPR